MTSSRERIRGLVCHFPAHIRNERLLLMLNVYIDDSEIGQAPLHVLAGWCATPSTWELFSDDWDRVLRMSPRIQYFKYSEARGFNGEFSGLSEPSRNEKVDLLMKVIKCHKLFGVASLMPHDIFQRYFKAEKGDPLRSPYVWAACIIVTRTLSHYTNLGLKEKIHFYFDNQPGQTERVHLWWDQFLRLASEIGADISLIDKIPHFLDDREAMPVQAADLHAGWTREMDSAYLLGKETPKPMWRDSSAEGIERAFMYFNDEIAQKILRRALTAG